MTTGKWEDAAVFEEPAADVLAGMVDDPCAGAVARAAAREAVIRGARLRVLQAVPPSALEAASAAEATFTAALNALRDLPQVPVIFEIVDGDVAAGFVERSAGAGLLVVGVGDPGEDVIAAHCQRYARCDVLTVRVPQVVLPN